MCNTINLGYQGTIMKLLFRKYLNSTLRPEEFREVATFIRDKKNGPAIFREIKPLWESSLQKDSGLPVPNQSLFLEIKETIRQEERTAFCRKIKIYSWGLKVAAILITGLIISTVFFYLQISPGQAQLSEHLQTITTPYGARTNIKLPDGSTVWLNSGTTISFPSNFNGTRPVKLMGEAYFNVVKDKRAFVVSTNYGKVEVKGTSFNVKAFPDDHIFETTLVEGKVTLKNKGPGNGLTLEPGQQASAKQGGKGFSISNVNAQAYTSWKDGKLIFSKEPFPSLIKKLERWYNVKIKYNNAELDKMWYTGTVEMESISEVMEMISKASALNYSFNSKTREFTIKTK